MKISVIIIVHNEGLDLEAVVALALASQPAPYEVIVVDDASDPPVRDRFVPQDNLTIYTRKEQGGVAQSRNFGASKATGDVFVFLDSHMRVPSDWLTLIEKAVQHYPHAIFCTSCCGFDTTTKTIQAGARFDSTAHIPFDRKWLNRGPLDVVDQCPMILGACYIVSRMNWERLGGINPNFFGWGGTEQDLSYRAWLYGLEVRRINGLMVAHRFGRGLDDGTFLNSWHTGYNSLVMAATNFEPQVFEDLFLPYMKQLVGGEALTRFQENLKPIMEFREKVQARRVWKDNEMHALCGYRLPTPHELRRTISNFIDLRYKERERVKIDTHIAYRPDMKLGEAYNEILEESQNEWHLFIDHDVLLVNPCWYEILVDIVQNLRAESLDIGLITCVTNRIESNTQRDSLAPKGDDISDHANYAKEVYQRYGNTVVDITDTAIASGFLMLINRTAWKKVGGFCKGFGVDRNFSERLAKYGQRIFKLPGLYVYHRRSQERPQEIKGDTDQASMVC